MRIFFSLFIITSCIFSICAQDKLPSLGIVELQATELSKEKIIKINKYIEAAFYNSNRFNIVSRQLQEAISKEREQQKFNIDKIAIEQGTAIGADYIVKGYAKKYKKQVYKSSPKARQIPQSKQNTNIPAPSTKIDQIFTSTQINFTIKILDVKTGIVIAEKIHNGSINKINHFVRGFVRSVFPQSFHIMEIMETKGDKKAKHLLVDGGFKHGLSRGTYLNVYEVTEENVDGKILTRDVEVGKLYVKRLDTGGHFSLCTVYKGRKEVLKKLNSNVKLVCKPPKSFRMFGMNFEYVY